MRLCLWIFIAIFRNLPWLDPLNILIQRANNSPNLIHSLVKHKTLHRLAVWAHIMFGLRRITDDASLVRLHHFRHSLHQITEIITQFAIIGRLKLLPSKIAIVLSWHVTQEIIAEGLNAVVRDDVGWTDAVTETLTHFGATNVDKAMH